MCEARLKLRRLSTLGTCTTNAHTSKRIRTHTHAQFYTQSSIYAYTRMCVFYTYKLLKVRPYRRFVSFRFVSVSSKDNACKCVRVTSSWQSNKNPTHFPSYRAYWQVDKHIYLLFSSVLQIVIKSILLNTLQCTHWFIM